MFRQILRYIFILFIYMFLIQMVVHPQEEVGIRYDLLTDIANVDISLDRFELSPSGGKLAVINHGDFCIYELENEVSHCNALPWGDTYTNGVYNLGQTYLEWEASEQFIAFSRYPLCCLHWDSDIWLYDIAGREFRNLTDDNVQDYYVSFEESATDPEILNIPIDFLPLWHSSSQFVYFFRAYPAETGRWFDEFGLYRVSIADGSIELIYDLSTHFKPPIYSASLSPDNTTIAMVVGGSEINSEATGIWLLNINENTIEYTLLPDTFHEFLSEQVDEVGFTPLSGIRWLNDNQLYITVQGFDIETNSRFTNFRDWFFNFEIEPQKIVPQNLLMSDLVTGTVSLFISSQVEPYFMIIAEPDNNIQTLYYGSNQEGFQLVAELPHLSSQFSNRVNQITDNNTILSGGLLIELPTMP